MPKKQYRHTSYAKAAKRRRKEKVMQVKFGLNISQTELARKLDLERYDVESANQLAKKLFLECLEKSMADHQGQAAI